MTVTISTEALDAITRSVAADRAVEACGLLFGTAERIAAAEPCRNVAADPAKRFEIDPARLLAAYRRQRAGGPRVIGCYHSHPTGRAMPSVRDAADAAPDGSLWLIVGGGETTLWRAGVFGSMHGRFDPVSLACAPCAARPD